MLIKNFAQKTVNTILNELMIRLLNNTELFGMDLTLRNSKRFVKRTLKSISKKISIPLQILNWKNLL